MCIYNAARPGITALALLVHPFVVSDRVKLYAVDRGRLVLAVLGLPLGEVGFWAESALWIVLEAALGCADLGGDEWGELGCVSLALVAPVAAVFLPFLPPKLPPHPPVLS